MTINWRPFMNRGFTQLEFQHYELANPSGPIRARSMLASYELALLQAVSCHHYQGWGEIIDGGPLLGVGTNMLARGLAHNPSVKDRRKRIHSFDLFLRDDMGHSVADVEDRTNSVFDGFLEINRDYLDSIYISPGDLLRHRWSGRPIEILFIDISKSWELNHWILREWFTCLRPGSIVIQQDYVYFHQYWIALTMEALADYFEHVETIFGASAVYVCTKEISGDLLAYCLHDASLETMLTYFDVAIKRASPSVAEVLRCGLSYCLLDNGHPDEAEHAIKAVRTDIGDSDPAHDFSAIAASNKRIVEARIAAQKSRGMLA